MAHPTRTARTAEPVVLPLDPGRGWREADLARRAFAVLGTALLLGWLVLLALPLEALPSTGGSPLLLPVLATSTALVLLGGPPACYSLARVLRPHPPGTGTERQVRHWCAAVATAYGVVLLTWSTGLGSTPIGFGAGWICLAAASTLGPVTVVWGVLVAAWRAGSR